MKGKIRDVRTIEALQSIYKRNGGLLHPRDIVDEARKTTSPLHKYFEWDNSKAAEAWRIQQARELLNITYVKIVGKNGIESDQRVFVSLSDDRLEGGYRALLDVMTDSDMRNNLIRDAIEEMQRFQRQYKELRELAEVFSTMRKAEKKLMKTA